MNNGQRPILKIISVATFPLVSVSVNICRACDARPPHRGAYRSFSSDTITPNRALLDNQLTPRTNQQSKKNLTLAFCGVIFVGKIFNTKALHSRYRTRTYDEEALRTH